MLSSTLLDFPACPAFLAGKTPASVTFPEFQGADQLLIKEARAMKLPGARFKRPGRLIKIRRATLYVVCSVAKSCPTLWDPTDCITPGFPVPHCLPEFAQVHVH